MILAIINKIQPAALSLASIIGIGNNRLERLALGQCHSINLSYYYPGFPYEKLLTDVMRRNFNRIQSIIIYHIYIPCLDAISREIDYKNLSQLTHLKIVTSRVYKHTGTSFTIGKLYSIESY